MLFVPVPTRLPWSHQNSSFYRGMGTSFSCTSSRSISSSFPPEIESVDEANPSGVSFTSYLRNNSTTRTAEENHPSQLSPNPMPSFENLDTSLGDKPSCNDEFAKSALPTLQSQRVKLEIDCMDEYEVEILGNDGAMTDTTSTPLTSIHFDRLFVKDISQDADPALSSEDLYRNEAQDECEEFVTVQSLDNGSVPMSGPPSFSPNQQNVINQNEGNTIRIKFKDICGWEVFVDEYGVGNVVSLFSHQIIGNQHQIIYLVQVKF